MKYKAYEDYSKDTLCHLIKRGIFGQSSVRTFPAKKLLDRLYAFGKTIGHVWSKM